MANPQMVAERVIVLSLNGNIQQIASGDPILVQHAVIAFDEDVTADAFVQHANAAGAIPGTIDATSANYSLPAAGGGEIELAPFKQFALDGGARTDMRQWFIKMSASGGRARVRYWVQDECRTPA